MKKILLFGVLCFVLLIAFNTVNSSYQLPIRSEQRVISLPLEIERTQVLNNLSGALQLPTISTMGSASLLSPEFTKFHHYLDTKYPLIEQHLTKQVINHGSLIYHWPGSDNTLKPILLLAHIDVVPASTKSLARWQHPPFSGTITDSEIWGRGALDIKTAITGQLEAITSLIKQNYTPKRSLYLAFGHDEEIGGKQGALAIAQHFKQRAIEFEYILDEGGSILEQGVIPGLTTPVAVIGVAEKGYVSLRLSLDAIGGHSSMPPQHTSVGMMSQAIVALENNPLPADLQFSKALFSHIAPKMPLLKRAIFSNMWLTSPLLERILSQSPTTNATIRSTTAVTMVSGSDKDNVLPNVASATVNFRLMPSQTVDDIIAHVALVIDNPKISITPLSDFQLGSQVSPADSAAFNTIATTIAQVDQHPDLVIAPYLVVGATDARHYEGLSPNIYRFVFNRYTPNNLKQMHGINERVAIADYIDSIKFYQQLIINSQP